MNVPTQTKKCHKCEQMVAPCPVVFTDGRPMEWEWFCDDCEVVIK